MKGGRAWTLSKYISLYFRDVYLYLRSLSASENIAEEITQETFVKALKQLKVSTVQKIFGPGFLLLLKIHTILSANEKKFM
jgi:DNA-directed RNA polymerase specialized sigma24 family protein